MAKFRYSHSIGFFAWLYIKAKGYSATKSEDKSMKIYDKYVFTLSKICDNLGCKYLFGKNILVVAQKPVPQIEELTIVRDLNHKAILKSPEESSVKTVVHIPDAKVAR